MKGKKKSVFGVCMYASLTFVLFFFTLGGVFFFGVSVSVSESESECL